MKNYLFILLSISLSICVNAQSNSFKYPSLDIELHPKVPAVCPDGLKITTVEDYLTYTWIHDETETVISNEKEAVITTAGDYTLEITSYVAGKPCFFEKKFNVIDLNNTDGIIKYLEESGFYKVPIWREDIPVHKPNEKNRSTECHEDLIRFSEEGGSEFVNIKSVSEDVLANFKPIKAEYGDHKNIFTENSCLCNNGIPDLESEFNSGETALWNHSFYENENDLQGCLYVKAKMPFEASLPLPEQMDFLKEIHPVILTENASTLKQGQTVLSDLFMARPIGGFIQQEQCNATFDIENSYFLSPAGMPIKPSSEVSNLVFQTEDEENGIFEGALLSFDMNGKNYLSNEYNSGVFTGYYNYINCDFIEDFEIPTNNIEYSSINLPFICEGECLNKKELINFDDTQQLVADGGFTYYTKSGIENKNIFLSEKSIKDWIFNKIYETKTYDNINPTPTFVTSDYNNKFLFITDVLLGGHKYEAIGMKINIPAFTGSTLVNLSNPQKVTFSKQEEFNYSIELDENILIAAFKTNITCNGFINNFYDIN